MCMRGWLILLLAAILAAPALAGAQPPPPRDQPRPAAPGTPVTGTAAIRGRVFAADGRYELTGLPAGRYTVSVSRTDDDGQFRLLGLAPGSYVVSATTRETWSGVQLIITDRVSTVAGHVSDEKGQPAVDGTIVVFAVDAGKWTDGSRYVRSMRTDQGGGWQIRGLPPGDYFAIALDYVEDGMWNDPDYLGSLQPGALKFALGEGEVQTLSLKLVAPDRR